MSEEEKSEKRMKSENKRGRANAYNFQSESISTE